LWIPTACAVGGPLVRCAAEHAFVSSLSDCRSTPTIFPHSVARHPYVSTVAAISLLLRRSTIHAPRRTGRLCLCYSTAHERRPTENSNLNRNLFVCLSTFGFVALLLLLCFAPPGGAAAPSDTLGHRLRDAAPGNAAQRKRGYVVAASVAPHPTPPQRSAPHRTAEGVVALLVH
jgi:hypothetical protein